MGINPKHLPKDGLACLHEVLGEAASLSDPLLAGFWDGGAKGRVVGVGNAGWVAGEDVVVVDFARDVSLYEGEVLVCWDLDGLEPGV